MRRANMIRSDPYRAHQGRATRGSVPVSRDRAERSDPPPRRNARRTRDGHEADRPLERRPVAEIFEAPELEGDEGPEDAVVVPHTRDVLVDETRDGILVEEATATHAFAREDLAQGGSERTPEPVAKGDAETLLPAPEDGGGKAVDERALEK